MHVYKDFPRRVHDLRIEKNLTQEQLADLMSVGKTSISNYENGYAVPTLYHLHNMAKIFNVSISYLIGETDLRERYTELPEGVRIPVFSHLNIDALTHGTESDAEGIIELPKNAQMRDAEFFAVQMWNDSMVVDHIFKNDYVILRRTKEINNGRIYLVVVEGLPYLHRATQKDTMLLLNPNSVARKYEPLQVFMKQADVVGRAVSVISNLS